MVKFVSHHYVAPKRGSNPGAAGKEISRFRAVDAGSTRLRLSYEQAGTHKVGGAYRVKLHVR